MTFRLSGFPAKFSSLRSRSPVLAHSYSTHQTRWNPHTPTSVPLLPGMLGKHKSKPSMYCGGGLQTTSLVDCWFVSSLSACISRSRSRARDGMESDGYRYINTVEHASIPQCISFIIMTVILVRDYTTFRYVPQVTDPTTLNYQVTGASGFVGSHVVDELLRQGYSVRGYAYVLNLHSCTV
jgi:hypothetical protein